jgi:16S rRNA C967 or C1407 C5-methylase (RsmB/RsmF family)/NOL1/NOP2/fmu family ribosome biogenesis protein
MTDVEAIRRSLSPLVLPEDELRDLSRALSTPPRPALRVRPGIAPESLPFAVESVAWHPEGYFVTETTRPGLQIPFAAGEYYIQDAASLLVLTALRAQRGERICDLCASPGGKATAILDAVGEDGWLLANETIGARVAPLRFNLARQGATQFAVGQHDPQVLVDALGSVFDAVLVDAPCTGQSLVSRGRQTQSAFSGRSVEHCAARQRRILQAAAQLVRPGGRLAYATCTFAYAENEGQIQAFLDSHLDFELEGCAALQPWESDVLPKSYRLWPHREGCGGAFAATLVRSEASHVWASGRGAKLPRTLKPARLPADFSGWGSLVIESVRAGREQCFGWSRPLWPPLEAVCQAGPEIAFRKGKTWFPSYALAMRRDANWQPAARVALDDVEAVAYVQGRPIPCNQAGWAVATWRQRPLGWLKGDGRRAKNHLPKSARLPIRGEKDRPTSP